MPLLGDRIFPDRHRAYDRCRCSPPCRLPSPQLAPSGLLPAAGAESAWPHFRNTAAPLRQRKNREGPWRRSPERPLFWPTAPFPHFFSASPAESAPECLFPWRGTKPPPDKAVRKADRFLHRSEIRRAGLCLLTLGVGGFLSGWA